MEKSLSDLFSRKFESFEIKMNEEIQKCIKNFKKLQKFIIIYKTTILNLNILKMLDLGQIR